MYDGHDARIMNGSPAGRHLPITILYDHRLHGHTRNKRASGKWQQVAVVCSCALGEQDHWSIALALGSEVRTHALCDCSGGALALLRLCAIGEARLQGW